MPLPIRRPAELRDVLSRRRADQMSFRKEAIYLDVDGLPVLFGPVKTLWQEEDFRAYDAE